MRKRPTYRRKPVTTIAKLARAVQALKSGVVTTKYFYQSGAQDLAGQNNIAPLMSTNNWSPVFDSTPIEGDTALHKYMELIYDVHCDNTNNEEETTNHTILLCSPTRNNTVNGNSYPSGTSDIYTFQGQARLNPQKWKTLYRKHFTITMGGTSPGTAGESRKYGRIFLKTNKKLYLSAGGTGAPGSVENRIFFLWITDNASGDLENPRLNWSVMHCVQDGDN